MKKIKMGDEEGLIQRQAAMKDRIREKRLGGKSAVKQLALKKAAKQRREKKKQITLALQSIIDELKQNHGIQ